MVLKLAHHESSMDHDDASVSSTLTVDRLLDNKQFLPTEGGKVSYKKHVTFDTDKNVLHTFDTEPTSDYKLNWYSPKEYKQFKSLAKQAAYQIIGIELKNTAPFSYQRVMEMTFAACIRTKSDQDEILPQSDFIHLLRWVDVATSRCGLEKWSLVHVSRDRITRRRELIESVRSIQQKTSIGNSNSTNSSSNSINDSDEFIRMSCENISRPSRLFARVMAKALEVAEQKQNVQCQQQ